MRYFSQKNWTTNGGQTDSQSTDVHLPDVRRADDRPIIITYVINCALTLVRWNRFSEQEWLILGM